MSANRPTPRRAELDHVAGDARQLSDDAWPFAIAFAAGFGAGHCVDRSVEAVIALVTALGDDASIHAAARCGDHADGV
jgi:hypothetical protein